MPPLSRLGEIIQQNTLGPCRGTTVANITLSGLQTIDSVVYTPGNRILVRSQTNTAENGIYIVGAGAWTRAPDWNGSSDIRSGTLVAVMEGLQAGIYQSSFGGALNVGTTEVGFSRLVQSIPDAQNDTNLFGGQPPSYYLSHENFIGFIPTAKISGLDNLISGLETNKADVAGTLAGYGIADAYTQTEINTLLNQKQDAASAFDGSAANLTGTLAAARISDGSLSIAKTDGLQAALDGKADNATTLGGYGITNALTATQIANAYIALSTPAGGQAIDTNTSPGIWILDDSGVRVIWADNTNAQLKLGTPGRETLIRSSEVDTKVDGKIVATRDHVAANFAGLTEFTALETAFNNFFGSPPANLDQLSELITELGEKAESVDVYTQGQVDTLIQDFTTEADGDARYFRSSQVVTLADDRGIEVVSANSSAVDGPGIVKLRRKRPSDADAQAGDELPAISHQVYTSSVFTEVGKIIARWVGVEQGADLEFDGYRNLLKDGEELATVESLIQYTAVNKTYAEMRAMTPSDGDAVYLNDNGGGRFKYKAGDYSNLIADDELTTGEGDGRIAVALTADKDGSDGAWIREDWLMGKTVQSWWWLLDPTGVADCSPSLQRFFWASCRMGSYQADGISLTYGAGKIQPGAFSCDSLIDVDLPDEAVFAIHGSGTHATRLIGSATNTDGVLRINHRQTGAKATKCDIIGFTIETKAEGGGVGFDISDRSGGLGNGTTFLVQNVIVRAWDINGSYFNKGVDFSGNSRSKFFNIAVLGPLDPGLPVNDYSANDTRWKPDIMLDTSGCYDVQLHHVIIQGGKYGWYNVQGSTRDASGDRQGQAWITGSADVGGFLRLKLDGADHGLTVSDGTANERKYRVSVPGASDSSGTYQYHTARITSVYELNGNHFAETNIPFVSFASAGHPFACIIAQDAAGEGFGASNIVINHAQYGMVSILAGMEASAVIHRDIHLNCAIRGAYIDGGQQLRFENSLVYRNHVPNRPDPADYPSGEADQDYIDDLADYNTTLTDVYNSETCDFEFVNIRQVTFRGFECRSSDGNLDDLPRTGFRFWNGPNTKAPTSLHFENMKIWGSYAKYIDVSKLGTSGDKAVGIYVTNPDCSGLVSGDTLIHAGEHCEQVRVTGFDYPDGISAGDADFIINDNTNEDVIVLTYGEMSANSGIVRFSHTVSVGAMAVGAIANVDIPNVLPASGNGSYIITGGLTGTADPLAVAGLGWDVLPDGGTGVRLLLCNNASSGTRNPDGVWKFEARYQP